MLEEGREECCPPKEQASFDKGAGCLKVRNKLASPGHPVRSPRSGTWSKLAAARVSQQQKPAMSSHFIPAQKCNPGCVPAGKAQAHNATS